MKVNKRSFSRVLELVLYFFLGAISIIILPVLSISFILGFIGAMLIGLRFLGPRFWRTIIKWIVNEILMLKKVGYKILEIATIPVREDIRIIDAVEVSRSLILINFITVLLITKALGVSGAESSVVIQQLIIALIITIIASIIVSPIGVGLYIVESSRYRILDPQKALLDYPGKLLRRILKAVFGYGNLIVLIWILLDSMKMAEWNISQGISIFLTLVLVILGAITLSSLIVLIIYIKLWKTSLVDIVKELNNLLENQAVSPEDALNVLKNMMGLLPESSTET